MPVRSAWSRPFWPTKDPLDWSASLSKSFFFPGEPLALSLTFINRSRISVGGIVLTLRRTYCFTARHGIKQSHQVVSSQQMPLAIAPVSNTTVKKTIVHTLPEDLPPSIDGTLIKSTYTVRDHHGKLVKRGPLVLDNNPLSFFRLFE